MSAIALALFLLIFYILPIVPPAPYEWIWNHAPNDFPGLVVRHGSIITFNGAFYAEMGIGWLVCLVAGLVFEWWSRRDDPGWAGLSAGFQRRSSLLGVDTVLLALFITLAYYCFRTGHPIHGPLSAAIATAGMLTAGPLLNLFKRNDRKPLDSDARSLTDDEPAPLSFNQLVNRTWAHVIPISTSGPAAFPNGGTAPSTPTPDTPPVFLRVPMDETTATSTPDPAQAEAPTDDAGRPTSE